MKCEMLVVDISRDPSFTPIRETSQDKRKLAVVLNKIFMNLLTFYSLFVFVMLNPATKA